MADSKFYPADIVRSRNGRPDMVVVQIHNKDIMTCQNDAEDLTSNREDIHRDELILISRWKQVTLQ